MPGIKCHVTFSKLNRKEIMEGETSEDVVRNIKTAFGIEQDISLQIWNKDFDDWINIECDQVTNMCRLNVIVDDTSNYDPGPGSPIATTSASSHQACQSGTSTLHEPVAPKTSASRKSVIKTPASRKNECTTVETNAPGTSELR